MGEDFDFAKYFNNFINRLVLTKEEMINRYIKGTITKQELDDFMKQQEAE